MLDCKAVNTTSLAPHFKFPINDAPHDKAEKRYMNHISYSNVVGSLMYNMICTRPDLAYFISVLSMYMADHIGML